MAVGRKDAITSSLCSGLVSAPIGEQDVRPALRMVGGGAGICLWHGPVLVAEVHAPDMHGFAIRKEGIGAQGAGAAEACIGCFDCTKGPWHAAVACSSWLGCPKEPGVWKGCVFGR